MDCFGSLWVVCSWVWIVVGHCVMLWVVVGRSSLTYVPLLECSELLVMM